VASVSDWVWEVSSAGQYIYCNQGVREVLGYEPREVIGKTPFDFMPPEEARRVRPIFEESVQRGSEIVQLENMHIRKDGRLVVLETSGAPIFGPKGSLECYGGIDRDITERKRLENALRESEERYRALVELSPGPIIVSIDDKLVYVNPVGVHLAGAASMEELLGRDLAQFTSPDFSDLARRRRELVLAKGGVVPPLEMPLFRLDGKVVDVEASTARIYFQGRPAVLTALRDITEQRRVEKEVLRLYNEMELRVEERTAQLEAANETQEQQAGQLRALADELVSTEQRERRRIGRVMHDNLQQLLVAAKVSIELMAKKPKDTENGQAAQRASAMLAEALQVARSLTAELSPPVLESHGLAAALDWLCRDVSEKYNLQVDLKADPAAEPPSQELRYFVFDSVRELLLNVAKHAGVDSARVELLRADEEHIQVFVEDHGKGFEPSAGAAPDLYSGTGLLRINQRVAAMGGELSIQSAPDRGTRITLTARADWRRAA
jgi:PAS domain S-box-containing protein